MRKAFLGLCVATCFWSACGGKSGSPTTPPPTTTSIAVNLRDIVLVGSTTTGTATATLSNGQTELVSATWRSDATAVATVSVSGTVTGAANGEATIIAASGGREGSKRIRVAPNYHGAWQGAQVLTTCRATGGWVGFCEDEENRDLIGASFPVGLTARHPGELTVSGEFTIENFPFPTFTTQVESDGSITFSSTATEEPLTVEVSWVMNSVTNGRATGTIREKYSATQFLTGDLTFDSTLSNFSRSVVAAAPSAERPARLLSVRSRIMARLRR
jgi:Bacterial Ig-like domain (group 2)